MVNLRNYAFVSAVLCLQQLLRAVNFISSTTNGSLEESWQFNFKLFAQEFNGVMLYCSDSFGNQFKLTVGKGSIGINYNNENKLIPTKTLCGCSTCDGSIVHFSMHSEKSIIMIKCNSQTSKLIIRGIHKHKNIIKYKHPMSISTPAKNIFITIGNIGYYKSEVNATQQYLKEQMIGCLYFFHYNNISLSFTGNNTKVSPSCSCNNNYNCNDGLCQDIDPHNYICDCSSTDLNGRYCNRSLRMYDRGGNNSYINVDPIKPKYLKMTWRQMFYKSYCLMEIVSEEESATIFTDKNNLYINSNILKNVTNIDGINFVIIIIWNNTLIVKVQNQVIKQSLLLHMKNRINIGFSQNNNHCKVFEGAYDLLINGNELRKVYESPYNTVLPQSATYSSNTPQIQSNKINMNTILVTQVVQRKSEPHTMIIGVTTTGLILFAAISILLYLRTMRTSRITLPKFTNQLIRNPSFYTETGMHGQVEYGTGPLGSSDSAMDNLAPRKFDTG